jgi:copper transport protein
MVRRCTARVLLALALVLAPAAAEAHAVLLESMPADGTRLDEPPAEVVLRFNEPVQPIIVRVFDPAGAVINDPAGTIAGDGMVRLALPPKLAEGSYIVSYRVTSTDGHLVAGSLVFAIGEDAAVVLDAAPDERWVAILAAINRAIHYGALLMAVGGSLFLLLVTGRPHPLESRLRGGLYGLIGLTATTGAFALGLAGTHLSGTALADLASAAPWRVALATSLGGSAIAWAGGLLLMGSGLALRHGRLGDLATFAGCLSAVASLALTGHAAAAPPRLVSMLLVFIHGLAAAFWAGSLWPLAVALRSMPTADAGAIVRRFSQRALVAVLALAAAGLTITFIQLETPAALFESDYGRIWLVKLGLVITLLCLAAVNRQVFTPRLIGAAPNAASALRRSIAVEFALLVGIIVATVVLGQTPPPRATAGHDHAEHIHLAPDHEPSDPWPFTATATASGYVAVLEVAPARAGRNRLVVTLSDAKGRAVPAREVTVTLALPEAAIEPFARALEGGEAGRYSAELAFPVPGRWELRVSVLVSDFEKLIFRSEVPIGRPDPGTASGHSTLGH